MSSDIALGVGALVVFASFVATVILMLYVHRFAERMADKDAQLEEYRLRVAACIDALRECQLANVTLGAAVREREESIGALLQSVNDANVKAEWWRQRVSAEYVYVRAGERIVGPFSVS